MKAIVKIERMGQKGQGVGVDPDSNIYFVPGALPGDTVEVEFPENSRRYRDAHLVQVIEPSIDRRESECKHFMDCGGCDWLNLNYKAQLSAKQQIVLHALSRFELPTEGLNPIIGAPSEYHYRNRIQLRVGGGKVGFYKRQSHEIVDIDQCQVAHEKLNQAISTFRKKSDLAQDLDRMELSVGADGEVELSGAQTTSARVFAQINTDQNTVLQALVEEASLNAKNVLELFCGDGNLTYKTLPKWDQYLGIDSGERAISAAMSRATLNLNHQYLVGNVGAELAAQLPVWIAGQYDTLILDPPRTGLGAGIKNFVCDSLVRIVYVSCSIESFTNDAQILRSLGFHLTKIQPLDMFPNTHHVELVASFLRSH